jgi:hypothetical protein
MSHLWDWVAFCSIVKAARGTRLCSTSRRLPDLDLGWQTTACAWIGVFGGADGYVRFDVMRPDKGLRSLILRILGLLMLGGLRCSGGVANG